MILSFFLLSFVFWSFPRPFFLLLVHLPPRFWLVPLVRMSSVQICLWKKRTSYDARQRRRRSWSNDIYIYFQQCLLLLLNVAIWQREREEETLPFLCSRKHNWRASIACKQWDCLLSPHAYSYMYSTVYRYDRALNTRRRGRGRRRRRGGRRRKQYYMTVT